MNMKFLEITIVAVLIALIVGGVFGGVLEVIPMLLFAFASTVFTYKLTQKWMANRIELMIETDDTTPHVGEERGDLMRRLLRFYDLQDTYDLVYNENGTFSYIRK